MPAGDDQRMRLNDTDTWFFWFTIQSILGKKMFCAPTRGTGPSMVLIEERSAFQRLSAFCNSSAVGVEPAPVAGRLFRRCAKEIMFDEAVVWTAKKLVGFWATAVPGKFR